MNKESSALNKLKSFCIERLWLAFLFAPLLVIAFMITQHVQLNYKHNGNRSVAMVVGTVEISAVELASIVAKPLTELLSMEVYTIARSHSVAAISNRKSGLRQVTYNQLSEIKRTDSNPISVLSYAITEVNETLTVKESS